MQHPHRQAGFTLVEIAIVVLVVTILLGYTVAMFPVQQELKQYREVDREMDSIIEHLIGFAQVNGRLPCPDTNGNINGAGAGILDGREDTDDLIVNATGVAGNDAIPDNCKAFSGFVPSGTIGMTGDLDDGFNLIDPWGQPYRYHVSPIDLGGDGLVDLVSPSGVRIEGLNNVGPALNLVVCSTSTNPSAADLACQAPNETIISDAAVIIYSSGKDRAGAAFASNIQNENRDDFQNGINDLIYTSSIRSDVANAEYDDKLRWISPSLLFSKMIQAEQLP